MARTTNTFIEGFIEDFDEGMKDNGFEVIREDDGDAGDDE